MASPQDESQSRNSAIPQVTKPQVKSGLVVDALDEWSRFDSVQVQMEIGIGYSKHKH